MILLFIPFLLFAFITKYENLKPYYLPNEPTGLNIKIILPKEENITVIAPQNYEYNLTKINPYIYRLHLNFKAKDKSSVYVSSKDFLYEINLSKIKIKNISLPQNFSHIYSPELKLQNVIASKYDTEKNIVSFLIKAQNVKNFSLPYEENLTLLKENEANYYILLPKSQKKLTFYYYNTQNNQFQKVTIPIIIKQETISTQTNLKPEGDDLFSPINIFILSLIGFGLIVFLVYQKVWLLIFPLLLGTFLAFKILPKGEVALAPNTKLYILPTKSTPFYETKTYTKAKILKKLKNYTKVEINNKIGWVKNEAIK
ncbi:MAG: hypothetical protein GXO62_08445 [Epsilonproteobacteria bacterium]|nr:hypothetical protein [Campylobacterota bacterium]